jgi:hypothetical protein
LVYPSLYEGVDGMFLALNQIQLPEQRLALIAKGSDRVSFFSWKKMADQMEAVQGAELNALGSEAALSQAPYFTVPVRVMSDLGAWGAASGYEIRPISQVPFDPPASAKDLHTEVQQRALVMAAESHNPAWAVCAEDLRLVFWRWSATAPCDEVMIPSGFPFTHFSRTGPRIPAVAPLMSPSMPRSD